MVDPSAANRRLLLRGADTLTPRGWTRLRATFTSDDPTEELAAAWGIKEQLSACCMPEPDRLWTTYASGGRRSKS
ncbi:hypothetical protein R1CP_33445 [Rhodococcus opacus]|uniref:Uncharacterized protein n=1 Tax=Rhodococcus opacus TaxID=37919 RepID=A0A1B1KFC4_RHOOP|nr:hypothetical protein R1CP_33445 [Rhodococcus opacus]